nr:DUF4932 domain-containing protein [Sabulibacter ruber]
MFGFQAIAQRKEILVEVNRNIELLSTLNNQISTAFLKDSAEDPYLYRTTRLMRLNYEHFKPYKDHPAVVATQRMSDKIGTGVYLLGLFYTDFPKPALKHPISEVILREIHPNLDSANLLVQEYFRLASRFYQEASFEKYFAQNQLLYKLAKEEVQRNLPGANFIPALEAYYGAKKDSYHLVVMPSFKSGWGLSWQIQHNGQVHIYNIAAPLQEQRLGAGAKVLEAGYDNPAEIRNLSVHEFGHSFVNPLTSQPRLAEQINRYQHLFKPIPNQGQYSDWLTSFNEHLVRAGEIRIAQQMGNQQESQNLQRAYQDWMYLPHFLQQLQHYEQNRKQYPRLEDYLPVLIASLGALQAK